MDLEGTTQWGPKEWVATVAVVVGFKFSDAATANKKLVVQLKVLKGNEEVIEKTEATTCYISADSVFSLTPTWMFKVEAYNDYTFEVEVFTDEELITFTVATTSQISVVAVPTTVS